MSSRLMARHQRWRPGTASESGWERSLGSRHALILAPALGLAQSAAIAQQLVVKPLAEKKVTELPAGPLFWRLENFPTLAQALEPVFNAAGESLVHGPLFLATVGAAGRSIACCGRSAALPPWRTSVLNSCMWHAMP